MISVASTSTSGNGNGSVICSDSCNASDSASATVRASVSDPLTKTRLLHKTESETNILTTVVL